MSATARAVWHARDQRAQRLGELTEWLAVPSISGDRRYVDAVTQSATLLARRLTSVGADARLVRTAGPPVVLGHVTGAVGGPTVLVYGHYDVQPPGPGWATPPFRPVRKDGRLYARGANDDKGQLYAWIAALGAWRAGGGLPCTVVVVADGDEETGGGSIEDVLERLASAIRPAFIVASDTDAAPGGTPTVTVSQRGHAVLDVLVDTSGIAVHSGRFGGAVVDPSDLLARGLVRMRAALMAAAGPSRVPSGARHVTVPDEHIHRAAGCRAVVGTGLHRRISAGPSMTVLQLRAGSARIAGAIPTTARATIDLRFPAHWPVEPAVARLSRLLRTASIAPGARTIVRVNSVSAAVSGIPISRVMRALDRATCAVFGEPVRLIASGGSLPAVSALCRVFAQPPVLLGLGASFSGAHGPGEYLEVAQWNRCVECLVHLLGAPPRTGGQDGKAPIG